MKTSMLRLWIGISLAIAWAYGCGNGSKDAKTEGMPPAALKSDDSRALGGIQPCRLLTAEQVATVLPGHDGGIPVLSGRSLIKGVDAYQCVYANASMDRMTVVLNIADNDENFSWIGPREGMHRDDRKIEIGDRGWVNSEGNELKIEVVKGRTIINLELISPSARSKADALIDLARIVAANIH